MPDHNREIDGLEYLLQTALWSSQNSVPESARVSAALHPRIVAELTACVCVLTGLVKFSDSGLVVVFGSAEACARF